MQGSRRSLCMHFYAFLCFGAWCIYVYMMCVRVCCKSMRVWDASYISVSSFQMQLYEYNPYIYRSGASPKRTRDMRESCAARDVIVCIGGFHGHHNAIRHSACDVSEARRGRKTSFSSWTNGFSRNDRNNTYVMFIYIYAYIILRTKDARVLSACTINARPRIEYEYIYTHRSSQSATAIARLWERNLMVAVRVVAGMGINDRRGPISTRIYAGRFSVVW